MAKMRYLKAEEIETLSSRPGVKKIPVENYLNSMGDDSRAAWINFKADARSYRWNEATQMAISDGIVLACGMPATSNEADE